MKNMATIFRREFAVYFQSPIGYMFIIVFLLINVGLYITPFFTFPTADMRSFFNLLPLLLSIFIPAVTMRLWADERKENTFEMLMTFPMKSYEIVLGKFLSALAFYIITLVGTFIIPIMLISLGQPDMGQIISAYFGALLLGAMLLAVGIFISVLCKDQIVAFILTLLINIAMYMVGIGFIQGYLDNAVPGLGSVVGQLLGFTQHYVSFMRGVVDSVDILFFISWTALFLFLNGFYLEIRNRPGIRLTFTVGVILALAAGASANWVLSNASLGRLDMTEGKIYTVSDGTRNILSSLKVPVNIKVYITPKEKMPTEMKNMERDIRDKLEEMRLASGNMLKYDVIHMQAANIMVKRGQEKEEKKSDKEEAIEKRMLEKGVRPFSVQTLREDSVTNVLVYSAIGVAYKEKSEEIIPRVTNRNIHELEYQVVSMVYKQTREKPPVVVLVAPKESVRVTEQMKSIYRQLGRQLPRQEDPYVYLERILAREKYDVKRVEISRYSPLPENYDTLAIVNPRELTPRQLYEINRALVSGKSVFMAIQKYLWEYRVQNRRVMISRREEKPQMGKLLSAMGLSVMDDILMDESHAPMTVASSSNPLQRLMGGGITLNLPIQMVLSQESMNPDISITSKLSGMFYLWGSGIKVDRDKIKSQNLTASIMMTTSSKGWTIPGTSEMTQASFTPPLDGKRKIPVSVLVSGQFPDIFKGQPRPDWPKESAQARPQRPPQQKEPEAKPLKPAKGKMILVGGTQMFRKEFLQRSNLDFFLNSIDALTLGENLIKVRSKKPISRVIVKPSDAAKTFWKFANYILVNLIFAAIGLIIYVRKKRSREAYTSARQAASI